MEGILLSVYVPMHTPFLRSQSALSCGSLCTCWHSKNSAGAPRSVYRWSSAAQQPVKELSVGERRSFSGWEWLFFALLEVAGHFCEIGLHPLLECSQRNLEPNPRLPDLTALTHVTWETPRELHCGTALVDCSGHQCWAASRQQPSSSTQVAFTSRTHLRWQILQLKSQRQFLWNNSMKQFSAPVFSLSFHTCLSQNQPGG